MLYGGFVNGDMTLPGSQLYRQTVLSGDINVGGNPAADAYHVVTITPGTLGVLIDGFAVQDGMADGPVGIADFQGGGIFCRGNDLELRNCLLTANFADDGAGLYFEGTGEQGNTLKCYRNTFFGNQASHQGAGAWINDVSRVSETEPSWMYNCQFIRNAAGTTPDFLTTEAGGGAYLGARVPNDSTSYDTFRFMNCRFVDNFVRGNGAALFIFEDGIADGLTLHDNVGIFNSTFAFNTVLATTDLTGGGAIYISAAEPLGGPFQSNASEIQAGIVWFNTTLASANPIAGPVQPRRGRSTKVIGSS